LRSGDSSRDFGPVDRQISRCLNSKANVITLYANDAYFEFWANEYGLIEPARQNEHWSILAAMMRAGL
jgi:hypothetical protein